MDHIDLVYGFEADDDSMLETSIYNRKDDVLDLIDDLEKLLRRERIKLSDILDPLNRLLTLYVNYQLQTSLHTNKLQEQAIPEIDSTEIIADLGRLLKSRTESQEEIDDEVLLDAERLREYEQNKRMKEDLEEIEHLERLSEFYLQKYKSVNDKWILLWQGWKEELKLTLDHLQFADDMSVDQMFTILDCPLSKYHQYYSNWTNSLRAFGLIIACRNRSPDSNNRELFLKKAIDIMDVPVERVAAISETIQHNINQLQTVRNHLTPKLSQLSQLTEAIDLDIPDSPSNYSFMVQFSDLTQSVMTDVANNVIEFTKLIIDQCMLLMNEACPCGLCVIGIGSLARGETTPYSDVEYFFLIESSKHRDYFNRLSLLTYFMITALSETNLKTLAIPELRLIGFIDRSVKGFRIDGLGQKAGNMPSGNGLSPGEELMFTPNEFLKKYKSAIANPQKFNSKGVTSTVIDMMAHLSPIWMNEKGADIFKQLQSDLCKIEPTLQNRDITQIELLIDDMEKYRFLPDLEHHCGKRDVKSDIYRFISLFLCGMNNIYHMHSSNNWECIQNLKSYLGMLDEDTAVILRFLLASAVFTRASVYDHYQQQNDRITVFETTSEYGSSHTQYSVNGELFTFTMSYLMPFKLNIIPTLTFLLTTSDCISGIVIPQDTFVALIATHFYCGSHKKVIDQFEQRLGKDFLTRLDQVSLPNICLQILYSSLIIMRVYTNESVLQALIEEVTEPDSFRQLFYMGRMQIISNCSQAARYLKKCLSFEIRNESVKASIYCSLSECYRSTDYKECKLYLEKHKLCIDEMLKDQQYSQFLIVHQQCLYLTNLCILKSIQGRYGEALKLGKERLRLRYEMCGSDVNTNDISCTLSSIALCYHKLGKTCLALKYNQKSLNMIMKLCESVSSENIATNLMNTGSVYVDMKQFKLAEDYLFKSYDMFCTVYRSDNHPGIIDCVNNIANCFLSQHMYKRSMEWSLKGYRIFKAQVKTDIEIQAYGFCLSNLSVCYFQLNRIDKAIKFGKKSFESLCSVQEDGKYIFVSEIVAVCKVLSDCLFRRKRYSDIIVWCERMVEIDCDLEDKLKSLCHHNISVCLKQLNDKKKSNKHQKLSNFFYVISRREYVKFLKVVSQSEHG